MSLLSILAIIGFAVAAAFLGSGLGVRLYDRFMARSAQRAEELQYTFKRMFKDVPLQRCMWLILGSALAGFIAGGYITGQLSIWPRLIFACILGYICWRIPIWAMQWWYGRWVRAFDDQLVDGLTMMANALRSGLSLVQALDLVAQEMPAPISLEFDFTLKEHKMGTRLDDSLERMSERVPSEDLGIVIDAILILRETGGNLSETFDTIVYTITERKKVQGKIRAMTAQGVAQGIILICMPFVLAYVLNLLNPDYMRPLFTTVLGWIFIGFMVIMLTLGGLMIRKIVKIDV